jgi:hypothetical protein
MKRSALLLRLGVMLLGCAWACGPDQDRGRPVNSVYLSEPGEAGAAGMPAGSAGEPGAAAAAGVGVIEPEPRSPPAVSAMMPISGPYGTEITIEGTDLGSSTRPGVSLLLGVDGAGELVPSSKPEVISWNETAIRFRFPFPYEGKVVVKTPEGEAVAGEFSPTWAAGPALPSSPDVLATASLSPAAGVLAAVINTGTPSMVSFDGTEWTESTIAGNNVRADSIRLYLNGTTLSAFALSTALAPVIIDLDPADAFAQTATTETVTADYRVAGGPDGATIWYRTGNNWNRLRPIAGVWTPDNGPIADPNPSGARHAAAATSSGALYVSWGVSSGTLLDDRGVVQHRFVAADATAFTTMTAVTGREMDDSISSIAMSDRGLGLITEYCGTDEDPLGVTASGKQCYSALLPMGPKTTYVEFNTLRYGFGPSSSSMAYCNPGMGTRLLPTVGGGGTTGAQLDAIGGDIVAWPCANVVALEVDSDGTPLLLIEQDGQLYSPRVRVE